jgi:hypothetical protein
VTQYLSGRLEARFRSTDKTEAHAVAHADRFAVHLSGTTLHDAELLEVRPRPGDESRTFRRARLEQVRIVPRDATGVEYLANLEEVEAIDVEYHDVILQDSRRFGRLTARIVARLEEPAPKPEPLPPPPPVPVEAPPAPPQRVEAPDFIARPSVGSLRGPDADPSPSRGLRGCASLGLPSCSTSGCGVLLWPLMLATAVFLALLALHAVAYVYTLVSRLWVLAGLPTLSAEGLPRALGWMVQQVNWGGVLVLGLLGVWWFGRRRR